MSVEVWAMMGAGITALVAGLAQVWPRFRVAGPAGKILVLGPVFEAVALAMFAATVLLAGWGERLSSWVVVLGEFGPEICRDYFVPLESVSDIWPA